MKQLFQEKGGVLSPFLKRQRYKMALSEISRIGNVLDIGCGEGSFRNCLDKKNEYFGLDIKGNSKNGIIKCDISEKFPLEISSVKFDYIIALAFIEHIKNIESFFKNCKKVLKEKGKIIISTPHPVGTKMHKYGALVGLFSKEANEEHENLLDHEDIETLCVKTGLIVIKYKRFLFGFNQLLVLMNACDN